MPPARALRSPLVVTLAVWKALFLREALIRLTRERLAWLWLLVEPLAHVVMLMWIFTVGLRTRVIAGADVGVFIMLGILGFFLVRNMMNRAADAVAAGEALYAYRQVKPVDTVFARAAVEALLNALLFIIILTGAGLAGHPIRPADPLRALQALGALWLTGFGLGHIVSVISNLVDEVGHMLRLLMTPAYLVSGVIFPISIAPQPIQEILLINPLVHGLEALRVAFMPLYRAPRGIELSYLVEFGVLCVFLGLALHIRFRDALLDR